MTRSRIVARLSGVKTSRLLRFVKRRVLLGGVGWETGGRLLRSSVRLRAFREEVEEDREVRGVASNMMKVVCVVFRFVCEERGGKKDVRKVEEELRL